MPLKHRGRKSAAELSVIGSYRSLSAPRTRPDPEPPPEHLTPQTKAWWKAVAADYTLDRHEFRTLQAAAEAWDRKEQAREALIEHGLTFTDDRA